DVGLQLGGGEDDNRQGVELRSRSHPFQNVEPIHPGHLQIQKYQPRQREFVPLGILTGTVEIIDHVLTVADNEQGVGNSSAVERASHHKNVVLIIFCQENWNIIEHLGWAPAY